MNSGQFAPRAPAGFAIQGRRTFCIEAGTTKFVRGKIRPQGHRCCHGANLPATPNRQPSNQENLNESDIDAIGIIGTTGLATSGATESVDANSDERAVGDGAMHAI